MTNKKIPELPGQLEIDFKERANRQYIQQNSSVNFLIKESLNQDSKLEWIKDAKFKLGGRRK